MSVFKEVVKKAEMIDCIECAGENTMLKVETEYMCDDFIQFVCNRCNSNHVQKMEWRTLEQEYISDKEVKKLFEDYKPLT